MSAIHSILFSIAHNFGAIVALVLGVFLIVAYGRGELKAFFTFLYEMFSGADGKPSSKNCGYFMGAGTLCWGFAKLTLAICRRVDAPLSTFDPTVVYLTLLSAITGLVGIVILGASAIQANLKAKLEGPVPPPDPSTQSIGKVENLIQEGPK